MDYGQGSHFYYDGKEYVVVGVDSERDEIECQLVPDDGDYYWFYVRNGHVEPIFPCLVTRPETAS